MRKLIPYNYILINGATLSDDQVDNYNAIQSNINSFITAGLPIPEYLINGSYNLMQSYIVNLGGN